jgi:hypothetical protein
MVRLAYANWSQMAKSYITDQYLTFKAPRDQHPATIASPTCGSSLPARSPTVSNVRRNAYWIPHLPTCKRCLVNLLIGFIREFEVVRHTYAIWRQVVKSYITDLIMTFKAARDQHPATMTSPTYGSSLPAGSPTVSNVRRKTQQADRSVIW